MQEASRRWTVARYILSRSERKHNQHLGSAWALQQLRSRKLRQAPLLAADVLMILPSWRSCGKFWGRNGYKLVQRSRKSSLRMVHRTLIIQEVENPGRGKGVTRQLLDLHFCQQRILGSIPSARFFRREQNI